MLREAYGAWRQEFRRYHDQWHIVLRVNRFWHLFRKWAEVNFPEILDTLRPGVSEDDLDQAEFFLEIQIPITTRILYHFVDGQEEENTGPLLGLIGGYCHNNMYLCSLRDIVGSNTPLGYRNQEIKFMVAASEANYVLLDCVGGLLHTFSEKCLILVGNKKCNITPCVPMGLVENKDGMLVWLEEHIRRLQSGMFKVLNEQNDRYISLFPEFGPAETYSTTLAHGIQVRASSLFMEERVFCFSNETTWIRKFTVSIRLSMMPGGCDANGLTFQSCQRTQMHWIVNDDGFQDPTKDIVNSGGETLGLKCVKFPAEPLHGGTPQNPILLPSGEELVYDFEESLESCSGSIEGSFTFIPGSIEHPEGDPFMVNIPRVTLQIREYIY